VLDRRVEMLAGKQPVDFAHRRDARVRDAGDQRYVPVRLAGQDCGRGTFSQRHAALYDATDRARYVPLNFLRPRPGASSSWSTRLLSEEAALGFEYGYSTSRRTADAVGGAVRRLLQRRPDPDRPVPRRRRVEVEPARARDAAAARLRRPGPRAQLGAARALPAAVCREQPARRRAVDSGELLPPAAGAGARPSKKPLVVMTPKSLLRRRRPARRWREFAAGQFAAGARRRRRSASRPPCARVVCCTGKVYYEPARARGAPIADVALVRVELLYPWPAAAMRGAAAALRCGRLRLVPGGAGQHGRARARADELPAHQRLLRAARGSEPGDRLTADAQAPAGLVGRGCATGMRCKQRMPVVLAS
jgi:2-oxoglutarate dehydrogenase E1 component